MIESKTKESLGLHCSPSLLVRLWLSGKDFNFASKALAQLSQKKSGDEVVVDGIRFQRNGFSVKIIEHDGEPEKRKASALIVQLTRMLSKKNAFEISTMPNKTS